METCSNLLYMWVVDLQYMCIWIHTSWIRLRSGWVDSSFLLGLFEYTSSSVECFWLGTHVWTDAVVSLTLSSSLSADRSLPTSPPPRWRRRPRRPARRPGRPPPRPRGAAGRWRQRCEERTRRPRPARAPARRTGERCGTRAPACPSRAPRACWTGPATTTASSTAQCRWAPSTAPCRTPIPFTAPGS